MQWQVPKGLGAEDQRIAERLERLHKVNLENADNVFNEKRPMRCSTSGAMQAQVFQYFAGEEGEKPVAIGGRGACETGQAKRSSTL